MQTWRVGCLHSDGFLGARPIRKTHALLVRSELWLSLLTLTVSTELVQAPCRFQNPKAELSKNLESCAILETLVITIMVRIYRSGAIRR